MKLKLVKVAFFVGYRQSVVISKLFLLCAMRFNVISATCYIFQYFSDYFASLLADSWVY